MPRGCARCYRISKFGVDCQAFRFRDESYDIAKANAILKVAPRDPIVVPFGEAAEALCDPDLVIHLRHVRHVNVRFPAIAVKRRRKWVFIDGNHRAFARLCRRLPVKTYLLTPRETRAIVKKTKKS